MTAIQQSSTFEVRAVRWTDHGDDDRRASERITGRYDVADAAAALATFASGHPDTCTYDVNRQGWQLTCVAPGQGERPARRLMNWEKNPDAEVSDGWLSNIAAAGNSLADRLAWEPEFCTRPAVVIPCPHCAKPLREYPGKWGAFYRCTRCSWKAGATTKKAQNAEARARVTGWCGTALVVRYNNNGVPYAGCPTCHPDHKSPTVNDVYYGRRGGKR